MIVAAIRIIAACCLLATVLPAPLSAEELDPTRLSADWVELITHLQSRTPLRAAFTEERKLPFRRSAIELDGTLRLDPEAGVSLEYHGTNESVTSLIDSHGLATRRGSDPWRPLPDRPELRAIHQAIGGLLRLDLSTLAQDYVLDGQMADGNWVLLLRPRPGMESGRLEGLVISGDCERIARIEASLGVDRGIVIRIHGDEPQATLSPEEYARFFR